MASENVAAVTSGSRLAVGKSGERFPPSTSTLIGLLTVFAKSCR
jgi:hypothetical protein